MIFFKAEAEAARVRIKLERIANNLHTLRAIKRFREDIGGDEDNEVEAIATHSAKKKRPDEEVEVIDLLSD